MAYDGFLYSPSGQQIYPTPRESPGKYKTMPLLSREIKRSITQYDHAELVSLSTSLCCRIPALRAAVRDKNNAAFSNWQPDFHGEMDEAWVDETTEYLTDEVMPNALLRELRKDFAWGLKISGMGLDMHGDDLMILTEDEQHNPKADFIPGPRIGNGQAGFQWVSTMFEGAFDQAQRADGMGEVRDGKYKGLPIYNGVIRKDGIPIAVRVLGFDAMGCTTFREIPLGPMAHYGCEMEFFGQGRGLPRVAASVLQWMKKEEIDDQFLKGLANAARHAVVHKLSKGQDAAQALGNAQVIKRYNNPTEPTPDKDEDPIFVSYTQDGNVAYIGADEELGGIDFENPHPNAEAFAVRILMENLADLGWCYPLLDTSSTGRSPTRLEMEKANRSIAERQSIQEIRSIMFFRYAVAKGMANGRIPMRYGPEPFKWGVGFPAELTVDKGDSVTSALNMLRMGLTNERIEAAKAGYSWKKIRRQRKKEVFQILNDAHETWQLTQTLGHPEFSFDEAVAMHYMPGPNPPQATPAAADPKKAKPQE